MTIRKLDKLAEQVCISAEQFFNERHAPLFSTAEIRQKLLERITAWRDEWVREQVSQRSDGAS